MKYLVAFIFAAFALPAQAGKTLHLAPGTVDGCNITALTITADTVAITCGPPAPEPPATTCTGKSSGPFTIGRKTPVLTATSSIAYSMAIATEPGKYAKYAIVGMPQGFTGKVTAAMSECPQDFDHPPYPSIYCTVTGPTAGFYVRGDSYTGTPTYASCPLQIGKQYYVSFKIASGCTGSCSFFVDYYGNF